MENQRLSGTDYADIAKPLAETLEIFMVEDFLFPVSNGLGIPVNQFFTPSLTTTGNEAYMINKIICYTNLLSSGQSDPVTVAPFQLWTPPSGNFITNGVSVGDIVLNTTTNQNALVSSVVSQNVLALTEDIFTNPSEGYAVYSSRAYSEAEKVSNGKISMLNASILTAPSTMFPAYTQIDGRINSYPASISGYGALKATYFRYPKPPKWTYVTLLNGEPSFDQSQPDYQDFELPLEDEFKLVMKILQYCGVSIREIEVAQFSIGQEQHEQPTFSQQQ